MTNFANYYVCYFRRDNIKQTKPRRTVFIAIANFMAFKSKTNNMRIWKLLFIALLLTAGTGSVQAQDQVEGSIKTDFVSSYIWRGLNLGHVSLQPELSLGWKGLSLTAWGSVGLSGHEDDFREIDLTLAYETGDSRSVPWIISILVLASSLSLFLNSASMAFRFYSAKTPKVLHPTNTFNKKVQFRRDIFFFLK